MDKRTAVKVNQVSVAGHNPTSDNSMYSSRGTLLDSTKEIKAAVDAYVAQLETGDTEQWCRCEWEVHTLPSGRQTRRLKDTDNTCPVHAREGLLLFFFEWLLGAGKEDTAESASEA